MMQDIHSMPNCPICPNPIAWDSGTVAPTLSMNGTNGGTATGQRSIIALSKALLSGTGCGTNTGQQAIFLEKPVGQPRLENRQIVPHFKAEREGELQERLALIHHDGNIPLLWAEGYARLCTMPRPASYKGNKDAWETLINNTGLFLDEWGMKAAALGWQAHDLFAVHRVAPTGRYDCMGLLPLLQRDTVIALSENTAKLRTPHNATQTFTRTPFNPDVACMVWEL